MRTATFLLTLLLTGCTGNLLAPSGSPPTLYRLTAPADVPTAAPQARWQLVVEEPSATRDLDTPRIAIAPESTRIDYYAQVSWADRAPAMVQELLLQTFERSGKIAAVQRQSGNVRSDFMLSTDLQNFEVEASAGVVHVTLAARLVRMRDHTIVASRTFDTTTPAGGNFDGTVAAFDHATQSLLQQVADWTLTQGNGNQ